MMMMTEKRKKEKKKDHRTALIAFKEKILDYLVAIDERMHGLLHYRLLFILPPSDYFT